MGEAMIISGYSLSVSWQYAMVYAEVGEQVAAQETAGAAPPEADPDPAAEVEETEPGKVRGENGVLRLLQEGHFKPHAEMRLLEIFHRDLEILQAQNALKELPVHEAVSPAEEAEAEAI